MKKLIFGLLLMLCIVPAYADIGNYPSQYDDVRIVIPEYASSDETIAAVDIASANPEVDRILLDVELHSQDFYDTDLILIGLENENQDTNYLRDTYGIPHYTYGLNYYEAYIYQTNYNGRNQMVIVGGSEQAIRNAARVVANPDDYIYTGAQTVRVHGTSPSDIVVNTVGNSGGSGGGHGPGYTTTHTMHLDEGWNLIPFGEGIEIGFSDNFEEDLAGAYVYHPYDREFYDIMENDDELEYLVDRMGYTTVWVYMEDDAEMYLEIDVDEIDHELRTKDFEFEEGWNFYVLLPQMQENYPGPHYNIHRENGHSTIESMWIWENGEWDKVTNEFMEWEETEDDNEIHAVLINYEDDFRPSYEVDVEVPDFPY